MNYDAELRFVKKLLNKLNLPFCILREPLAQIQPLDISLRRQLNLHTNHAKMFLSVSELCSHNKIYKIHDAFYGSYLLFQLPDTTEPAYACAGPYRTSLLSPEKLLSKMQQLSSSPSLMSKLERFYQEMPFISDEKSLFAILLTLGEHLWGSADNFSFHDVQHFVLIDFNPIAEYPPATEPEDLFLNMKLLETYYLQEKKLLLAVSRGQITETESLMDNYISLLAERYRYEPLLLREMKNHTIMLNTLLRKAAETGVVHPIYIDSLFSRFVKKIELSSSQKAIVGLQKEMIHKYCLLVKNHSLKDYSHFIRSVLVLIDVDLTADLSLSALSELLNVSSCYLSSLFKKELGITLTEYVTTKRMEHAIFLLNTTSLQIQSIALHCGIPDVNYFSKTFKKYIGKTPKEYRNSIMPCKNNTLKSRY